MRFILCAIESGLMLLDNDREKESERARIRMGVDKRPH